MAFNETAKLVFEIRADTAGASANVNKFRDDLKALEKAEKDQLSPLQSLAANAGLSASEFKTLTSVATVAAGAITAVAGAALAGAAALFKLTESAAAYGSEIFDASQKTGIGTDTLEAFKFAADQSGESFEALIKPLQRFTVLVGQASAGSEKAEKTLEKYGITARTTEEALIQAIEAINNMKTSNEQNAASAELFKDKAGTVINVLREMEGDLPGQIQKLRDLGILIGRDNAEAADKFGDQMDVLKKQLAGVGYTIGFEVMPIFMDMARATSNWATQNKGEIEQWASAFAKLTQGMLGDLGRIVQFAKDNEQWIRIALAVMSLGNTERAAMLGNMLGARYRQQQIDRGLTGQMGGGISPLIGGGGDTDTGTAPRTRRTTNFDADRAAREAEQRERERIARIRENLRTEIAEKESSIRTLLALEDQRYAEGILNEEQYVAAVRQHEDDLLRFIIEAKYRELTALRGNAEEEKRLKHEIQLLNDEIARKQAEYGKEDAERRAKTDKEEKELHEQRKKRWNEMVDRLRQIDDIQRAGEAAQRKQRREQIESQTVLGGGGIGASIGGALGASLPSIFGAQDEILSQADFLKGVYADVADFAGGAIGSMIDGLADLALQWILTGEFSAEAALKMAAGIALGVAKQALVKGVFEIAEAIAATARLDFAAAALHTAAAKVYFTVAAIAGAAGVGLALGARAAGGGGSAGPNAFASQQDEDRNDTTGISQGNRDFRGGGGGLRGLIARNNELVGAAIETFSGIRSIPAGEVIVQGARSTRGQDAIAIGGTQANARGGRTSEREHRSRGIYR